MSEILIFAEIEENELHSTSGELIAAGRKMADSTDNSVSAALIGGNQKLASELITLGADKVYLADDDTLREGIAEVYIAALHKICLEVEPIVIITSKSPIGRTVGPRIAYRLGTGIAQDCTDVSLDNTSKRVTVTRPVYGGNAMAKFTFADKNPQVMTMRLKAFEPAVPESERSGEIIEFNISIDQSEIKSKLVETVKQESEGVRLEDASVIIGMGRGLGGPEPFSQLEDLAKVFNGAVGASRAVCDAGWLDHSYQIGLTGKTVTPDVYITVGISGASQHMAGCSASKNIVAINKDGDANIFKEASFGVVGDWEKILPAFTETARELLDS
ncbi:MAG TPA: electron transfer flavoprotein subunit alpha [Dehalococcoidia bacterium]|jgi:electron transfer flavoprotein alpha subunit|nr:electron transfer flavoprotein subunit alpha [Chloroflexota bacterium]HCE76771.1 electron transfer flavoprotein subunit alpha [Dehalococcoidia bacterium]|tara:strand:+ start:16379 stop:17368 length:990 start_codon:yes stop_codon:yes gene_type:complete